VLTIRLSRIGKKKKPFYRVVVIERTRPRDGRVKEAVGTYDPLKKPAEIKLDAERAQVLAGPGSTAERYGWGAQFPQASKDRVDPAPSSKLRRPVGPGCHSQVPMKELVENHCEGARGPSGGSACEVREGAQVIVLELQVHPEDLGQSDWAAGADGEGDSNGAWRGGDQGTQAVYRWKSSKIDGLTFSPTIEFRKLHDGSRWRASFARAATRAKSPRNCSLIFRNGLTKLKGSFCWSGRGKTEPRLVALKSCWLSQNHRGQIVFISKA